MLKFLVPNAITSLSIVFGVLGIEAAIDGDPRAAAWWILYCAITDKVDGLAARLLKASSSFGVQLDSLADLVSFGVAPAVMVYAFFIHHPGLGWATHPRDWLLAAFAVAYALATALRLARFNVAAANGPCRYYLGTPSTFAGSTMAALFATLLKYGDRSWGGRPPSDWQLLGSVYLGGLMPYVPWCMALAGVLMVSNWRVPRVGKTPWRLATTLIVGNVAVCYGFGIFRRIPEYLLFSAGVYVVVAIAYHVWSGTARAAEPPEAERRAA